MTDCILSPYAAMRDGYSKVFVNGKRELAHRVAYCTANNLLLTDIRNKVIRHTCDNPKCLNPAHLIIGTQADNIKDMIARGTGKQNLPKVSKLLADKIRQDSGAYKVLALRYDISMTVVSNIINRKGAYK
jgi:Zinc-binding loop region of homing endonuclease